MKRIFILTAALLALAITAQTANAEPTDPIVRGDLEVQIIGQGKVTGTGIDCPGDCAQRESWPDTEGGPVNTLTATANSTTSNFAGWSGACTGAMTTCNVTMDQARSVTATLPSGSTVP